MQKNVFSKGGKIYRGYTYIRVQRMCILTQKKKIPEN